MSLKMPAGAFLFDLSWERGERPVWRDFLRFYRSAGLEPRLALPLSVLESQDELSQPEKAGFAEFEKNWRFWKDGASQVLQIWCGLTRKYAIEARFEGDFERAEVTCLKSHPHRNRAGFLLETLVRWWAALRCAQLGGFLLHGACIQKQDGRVYLASGPSGAGKTTLSRFFARYSDCSVLTDETVMVLPSPRGKGFWGYGTPWSGMLRRGVNTGGPVEALFFLAKTAKHQLIAVSAVEGLARLGSEIYVPPVIPGLVDRVWDSLTQFEGDCRNVILSFAKSKSVVSFVEQSL